MIDIDHPALPPPEPARPILASHLLSIEENQRRRFTEQGPERVRTGCAEVDDYVLGGGLERGIVVGLSGEGDEGRLLSLNLLASILLSHLSADTSPTTSTKATIIDTTGSLPIPLLASIIKSRIISSQDAHFRQKITTGNYEVGGGRSVDSDAVDRGVQRCLEMVAISRVFDLEGLWEVLGEVRRDSGTRDNPDLDIAYLVAEKDADDRPHDEGTELLIIDNMSHILNELFSRKEKGEAHTLLATLSRIIHTLAHTSNILTLLHNTTTSTKPTPASPHRNPPQQTLSHPSIFAANPVKPALGRIFDQFVDLHILLSPLPRRREDAELLYGRDEPPFHSNAAAVEYCTVVEVLKDETPNVGPRRGVGEGFGRREQRWAAVAARDGVGLVASFPDTRSVKGVAMARGQDVGSVAKMYGFGGRRV